MATSRAAACRPAPTSLPPAGCPKTSLGMEVVRWVYIGHTDGRHPLQEPQWCRADRCTSGRTRSCRPQIWLRAGEWATNREQANERRRRHGPRLRLTTRHACKTRIGLAGATDGRTEGGRAAGPPHSDQGGLTSRSTSSPTPPPRRRRPSASVRSSDAQWDGVGLISIRTHAL